MKCEVIVWDGRTSILEHGSDSARELYDRIRTAGYDTDDYLVGTLQRFRKRPARGGGLRYNVNKSRHTRGSFVGRIVQPYDS